MCVRVPTHTHWELYTSTKRYGWRGRVRAEARRPGIYSQRSRRKEVAAKIAWVGWGRVGCKQYYYGVNHRMAGVGLKEHF